MKPLNDIWRQLVGRRLLPVAIILAAGLVAVPLVLAKDPEPAATPALKPVDESAAAATKTIVALAQPATARRAAIGKRNNPFAGEKLPKAETADDSSADGKSGGATASTDSDSPTTPAGGGGTTPTTPSTGTPTTPSTGGQAPKRYERYELDVRFGDSEGDLDRRSVRRLSALPSAGDPLLVYLGVMRDGKTAAFMIDDSVTPVGDGRCKPSTTTCETVLLRAGETEFFDVVDETGEVAASYQLDLLKIHGAGSAGSARTARRTAARAAAAGLAYDRHTGRLHARSLHARVAATTVALP